MPHKKLSRRMINKIRFFLSKPWLRVPFLIFSIIIIYFAFFPVYNLLPVGDGSIWNSNENGIWLSRRWMRAPVDEMTENELREFLDSFKKRGIRYLFPHCCPMDEKGHFPHIHDETVRRLCRVLKDYDDFFILMPWIGGSIATVDLSNTKQRDIWIKEVKELVELYNLPGVNVNIEPLEHGDKSIILWMKKLKEALGKKRKISFCGIRPEITAPKGDPLGIWTAEDYENLSVHVDQITVMAYDTGRKVPIMYVSWNAKNLKSVCEAVRKGSHGKCRVLWGLPVYEDKADYFKAEVENIRTSLRGTIKGLKNLKDNEVFQGVSIYSNWTIDENEWEIYDKHWIGKK
jgi:glycosyl hydrolase family 18 (putative chitinase)